MNWYGVRHVVEWGGVDEEGRYTYEERLTIWNAESFEDAISHAEREAAAYVTELVNDGEVLDLWQAFQIFQTEPEDRDETDPAPLSSGSGVEVFSLIRDSDLEPTEYLDRFFDTGTEHQAKSP
jgi:hypothetical protein